MRAQERAGEAGNCLYTGPNCRSAGVFQTSTGFGQGRAATGCSSKPACDSTSEESGGDADGPTGVPAFLADGSTRLRLRLGSTSKRSTSAERCGSSRQQGYDVECRGRRAGDKVN